MLPVLFHIGSFPVRSWGLLLMAGFLLAAWRAARNSGRYRIASEDVWDIALVGLFGGVIGARLFWVAQNIPLVMHNPLEIFAVWTGGMTFYGGLFGGVVAGVLACRKKGVNVADMADLAGASFPIGYFFGRIGCFLNGCCYGGQCDLPWAVKFRWEDGIVRASHPAQLYSAGAAVLMFIILYFVEKQRRFPGQVMIAFVGLYGIYRFFIEFVRVGATADLSGIGHLTVGQIASLIVAIGAAIWYTVQSQRTIQAAGTNTTATVLQK